ncbi:hypothetical protein GMDG_05314 [Pseudogymnoascus destructans 20631-21]|uniref:Uncharacterized protein n=1 Tax=Pseudogymnoascus destructans (strain ATCC MYA-4855 / 20631-21) TaxID=658429 RepID=L8FRB7_PSED2|nr:hypothetical protein GMDG_05314 [Pseudogymnoascus destructans 20631-21]
MSAVESKGKVGAATAAPTPATPTPATPTPSQAIPPDDEDMPDAEPVVTELRETLCVKLPDTYSGNCRELEVLYTHFNDDKFPTNESYALWTSSYLRGEAL